MQIIVQEGEASVSLVTPIQAPDDSLRTTNVQHVLGQVKVYYRDFEVYAWKRARGAWSCSPPSSGHQLVAQRPCYQLKPGS